MKLTIEEALQKGIEAHKAGQVKEADRLYTAILNAQPKHPDANHNMGVLAVGIGKVETALPLFKTALEANPSIAQFWLSYIDALIKLDRIADAKAVFDQAKSKGAKGDVFDKLEQQLWEASQLPAALDQSALEPQAKQPNILDSLTLDQALKLAMKKEKDGTSEEAKRIYQDVLLKFPKNKRAKDRLKELRFSSNIITSKVQDPPKDQVKSLINLYSKGQLKQAIEQANTLLVQFPNSATLYNIQGVLFKGLGQLDLSVEVYKKALAIKPDYAMAYYNMGATLQEQGKLDEAKEAYKKALVIKPDFAEAYYNIGNALQNQSKLGEAIKAFKKAVAVKPDYAEAYNNMGAALQDQGKMDEAIQAFNKVLAIEPDYTNAYNNMGNALKDQGKLDEAIVAFKKALAVKPDYAEAYSNMGIALKDQGKLDEAIVAFKKALAVKPDYAEAYSNMGIALKDQGKLEEAIATYNKSLAIKPDFAEAYNNMGVALKEQGKLEEAIAAYNKSLAIKPDYAEAYNNMGNALKDVVFEQPNPGLQKIITSLLEKKSFVRPSDISRAALSLLKLEPKLKRHLQSSAVFELESNLLMVIEDLAELPLLLKLMSVCPLPDLDLEYLLKELRARLLSSISNLTGSSNELEFQSALALQCFTNEYIYDQSEYEDEALKALEWEVKQVLSIGDQPSPQSILSLSSYKPLYQYEWSSLLRITKEIEEVFTRQILEPDQESQIKTSLPVLEEITDKVSSKVRGQYEVSPYPRWVNLGCRLQPAPISKLVEEVELKLFDDKIKEVEAPNILIAGCGTGQHSIGTATRFKDSQVLAIDLSLSSLGYAKRKTEELGIQNIDYMQADILDLGKLDRQFDIVESAGVLHHMDDPVSGWRVLTDCLKPGGLMMIGLYSDMARQHIVEMRREINAVGIGTSDATMKSFRKTVMTSDQSHHRRILDSLDFYSLSTLKDLLFHVQEHRFSIPQIQECLNELGLKFCGFETAKIVSQFKKTNTGADDPYDLGKWQVYEEANPRAFAKMYQFWCQKIL